MSTIFFTADTHFRHNRICEYSKRPFPNAVAMEEAMVATWNARVKPDDVVYHLGDFAFGRAEHWIEVRGKLNGRIVLIRGNHDAKVLDRSPEARSLFVEVTPYKEMKIDNTHVVLCHFPFLSWNRSHYGALHLHGHSHGMRDAQNTASGERRLDVGVDSELGRMAGYAPIPWETIRDRLTRLPIRSRVISE